jgi:SAM-dependent methyltransferase
LGILDLPRNPAQRPDHWKAVAWEQMAQENPLFAVMTTEQMAEAPPSDFSPEQVEALFEKGRRLFSRHIAGALAHAPDSKEDGLVVEYGCGVGRMLNAALEAGHERVAGIDISPTMLAHARRLVPGVEALYPLDENGRSGLPDACASAVFSYAVVQHISLLSRYFIAFEEMRRILKPGGVLVVQLNSTDFERGDFTQPGRTENQETSSLHYRPGSTEPYLKHEQDQWSGVYISSHLLADWLARRQMRIIDWRRHTTDKSLAVWLYAKRRGKA